MKNPTMLYRIGTEFKLDGEFYDTLIVAADDVDEALKNGWSAKWFDITIQDEAPKKRRGRKPKAKPE